ncbi:MAG: hypothetical protein LUC91_11620 [Prevotella sp.]|nr:hypothetical protein [Prevotella sp.]
MKKHTTENSHLNNGTLLQGGKYKIVRFIGSGGFGCTYEAEHVLLGKRMAIKEFFPQDFCNHDEKTAHVSVGTKSKKGLVEKLRKKLIAQDTVAVIDSIPSTTQTDDSQVVEQQTEVVTTNYINGHE